MSSELDELFATRALADYGAFLLPHLNDGITLLDCGCGPGSMTYELAELLPIGRVVGIDREDQSHGVRAYASARARTNVSFAQGDVGALPLPDASVDAVFAHSMIETLAPPVAAVGEMRRVLKDGGVIGVASVDYSGLLLAGPAIDVLRRSYALRERVWVEAWSAEPRRGAQLRALLTNARFRQVRASARYVSYGDEVAVARFGEVRAADCEDGPFAQAVLDRGFASRTDLDGMASAWRAWGASEEAFLAFPWCNAVGWK